MSQLSGVTPHSHRGSPSGPPAGQGLAPPGTCFLYQGGLSCWAAFLGSNSRGETPARACLRLRAPVPPHASRWCFSSPETGPWGTVPRPHPWPQGPQAPSLSAGAPSSADPPASLPPPRDEPGRAGAGQLRRLGRTGPAALLAGVGVQASAHLPTACDTQDPAAPGGIISEKNPRAYPTSGAGGPLAASLCPKPWPLARAWAGGHGLRRAVRRLQRGAASGKWKHRSPR